MNTNTSRPGPEDRPMRLTDFLLARLTEDEATLPAADLAPHVVPRATRGRRTGRNPIAPRLTSPGSTARAAAALAANRRIVEAYRTAVDQSHGTRTTLWGKDARFGLYTACVELAKVYAAHPDYRRDLDPA